MGGYRGSVSSVSSHAPRKSVIDMKDPFHIDQHRVLERMRRYFYQTYTDHDHARFFDELDTHLRDEDNPVDGRLNIEEMFMWIVKKLGLAVKRHEIMDLVDHYDLDRNGTLGLSEFKSMLTPDLSMPRKEMIFRTWKALEARYMEKKGRVELDELMSHFEASCHPEVKRQHRKASDVFEQFRNGLETPNKFVVSKGFHEFHKKVSFEFEKDDDFCEMMSLCWGIAYIPKYALTQLFTMLKRAVERECKAKGIGPAIYLEETYNALYQKHPTWPSKSRFDKLLAMHGVNLDEYELDAVFTVFDIDHDGEVDEKEFRTQIMWEFEHSELVASQIHHAGMKNNIHSAEEITEKRLQMRNKDIANMIETEKAHEEAIMQSLVYGQSKDVTQPRRASNSVFVHDYDDGRESGAINHEDDEDQLPQQTQFANLESREERRLHRRVKRRDSRDARRSKD